MSKVANGGKMVDESLVPASVLRKWITEFDQLIEAAKQFANFTRAYSKLLSEPKYHHLYPAYNKSHFAALGNLDLLISLKYLNISQSLGNAYEANHFARTVALHTYEILENPSKLLSKEVRQLVIDAVGEDALTTINSVLKQLNEIKKAHGNMLKEIRHNVIAHKADQALEQFDLMRGLKLKQIFEIGSQVAKLLSRISFAYTDIFIKLSSNP